MKCLHPKVFSVYQYTNRRISGSKWFVVPCGKCINCLVNNSNDWTLRIMLEAETSLTAWFITLTMDDAHLHGTTVKDIQRFMNSMRKKYKRLCEQQGLVPTKLAYFAVGEYGREENRPHYHLVLFNFPCHDWRALQRFCEEVWYRGFVKVEPLTIETAGYVAKYLTKIDPRPHDEPPFRCMSLKPAIGFNYFGEHPEVVEYLNHAKYMVITMRNGRRFRVPRSIRSRFLSPERKCEIYEASAMSRDDVDKLLTPDYLAQLHFEEQRKLQKVKKRFSKGSRK